jgi:hypothetical protein
MHRVIDDGVVQEIHHKVSRGIGGENRLMHGLCAGFEASHHHQSHGLGGSSRIIRGAGRICKPGG